MGNTSAIKSSDLGELDMDEDNPSHHELLKNVVISQCIWFIVKGDLWTCHLTTQKRITNRMKIIEIAVRAGDYMLLNYYGEVFRSNNLAEPIPELPLILSISGLECYFAIARDTGALWMMGKNPIFGLNSSTFQEFNKYSNIRKIAFGSYHLFFLFNDGTLLGFGTNEWNQIGKNPTLSPVTLKRPGNVIDVACGDWHSLFLTKKGEVYSCGRNSFGQTGRAECERSSIEKIRNLPYITEIACGKNHSLCVDESGSLWTFGRNNNGQLGYHTEGPFEAIPRIVENLPPVASAARGLGDISVITTTSGDLLSLLNQNENENDGQYYRIRSSEITHSRRRENSQQLMTQNRSLYDEEEWNISRKINYKPRERISISFLDDLLSKIVENNSRDHFTKIIFVLFNEVYFPQTREEVDLLFEHTELSTLGTGELCQLIKKPFCMEYRLANDVKLSTNNEFMYEHKKKRIACGSGFSSFIAGDGKVCTIGTLIPDQSEEIPTIIEELENICEISCGERYLMCLSACGDVWILGTSDVITSGKFYPPTKIEGIPKIISISCGKYHSVFVSEERNLWVIGSVKCGSDLKPRQINGISNVVTIFFGDTIIIALCDKGKLVAYKIDSVPIVITETSNVIDIESSGSIFSLLLDDGTVCFWDSTSNIVSLGHDLKNIAQISHLADELLFLDNSHIIKDKYGQPWPPDEDMGALQLFASGYGTIAYIRDISNTIWTICSRNYFLSPVSEEYYFLFEQPSPQKSANK